MLSLKNWGVQVVSGLSFGMMGNWSLEAGGGETRVNPATVALSFLVSGFRV
jgi:hypothetical protein